MQGSLSHAQCTHISLALSQHGSITRSHFLPSINHDLHLRTMVSYWLVLSGVLATRMGNSLLPKTGELVAMGVALIMVAALLPTLVFASPPSGRINPFSNNYCVAWSLDHTNITDRGYSLKMWLDSYTGIFPSYLNSYLFYTLLDRISFTKIKHWK